MKKIDKFFGDIKKGILNSMIRIFSVLFVFLCLEGCDFSGNDKHEKELFDKIKIGMQQDEVIEILGNPDTITKSFPPHKNAYYYYFTQTKNIMRSQLPVIMFDSTESVVFATYGD